MAQELKVKIGADISNFTSQLSKAGSALSNNFSKSVTIANNSLLSLDPSIKGISASLESVNPLGFSVFSKSVNEAKVALDELFQKVVSNSTELANNENQQNNSSKSTQTLKAKFRELKEELFKLENEGKKNSQQYKILELESAKLADQIRDQAEAVRALSSDTFAFDVAVQSINVVASAWQGYEAILQLSGSSTEDVQKSIQKMMAVMAVANSIQQAATFLTGQSAAKKAIDTVLTYAQATAYRVLGTSAATASIGLQAFSIALAGTGIGVLLVALGSAVAALMNLGNSAGDTGDKSQKLNEKINNLIASIKTLSEIKIIPEAQAAGQIAEVKALSNAVNDSALTDEQKAKALERLKKISKDYFGDFTLQSATVDKLNKKVSEFSKSLVSSNRQSLLKDEVNNAAELASRLEAIRLEKAKAKLDKQDELNKAEEFYKTNPKLPQTESRLKKLREELQVAKDEYDAAVNKWFDASRLFGQRSDELKAEIVTNLDNFVFTDKDNKVDKAVVDLRKKIVEKILNAKAQGIELPIINISGNKDKLEEALKQVENIINTQVELRKKATELNSQYLDIEIEDLKSQIEEKKKLNLESTTGYADVQNKLFELSKLRIDKEYNAQKDAILSVGSLAAPLAQQSLAALQKIYDSNVLKLTVEIYGKEQKADFNSGKDLSTSLAKNAASGFKNVSNTVGNATAEVKDRIANFYNSIGASVVDGGQNIGPLIEDSLVGLSQTIGKVLMGNGSIGDVLAAGAEFIIHTIGNVLEDLGKQLIELGVIKVALDNVLKGLFALPGAAQIAVGIGLVALGAAFKSFKSSVKNATPFAEGGIVTGPTLAMVGEAGSEAIIPLSKFDQVVGGRGTMDVFVTGQLSGEMIFLQQQRAINRRERFV